MTFLHLLLAQANPSSRWFLGSICIAAGVAILIGGIVVAVQRSSKLASMSPEEREEFLRNEAVQKQYAKETQEWGPINPPMICPHCNNVNCVRAKRVIRKKGVSGGKATGALLTWGFSILATGLSRKEEQTQAHCTACGNTWDF